MHRHLAVVWTLLLLVAGIGLAQSENAEPRPSTVGVNPETGQAYRVAPVKRVGGQYRFLDDEQSRVRLQFGMEAEVERLEEDTIWIRVYDSAKKSPAAPSVVEPPPLVSPETTSGRLNWLPTDDGLPRQGLWREGMDFGDFDGDGRDELVLPPARKARAGSAARPRIYRRISDGSWSVWDRARFPAQPYDYGDVAVLDFDGDGVLDLAFGMHLTGVQLFRGVGDGAFDRVEDFPPGQTFHSRSVQAVHLGSHRVLLALGEGMAGARPQSVDAIGRGVANRGLIGWIFADGETLRVDGDGAEIRFAFGDDFALGSPRGDGHAWLALGSRRLRAREVLVQFVVGEDGVGMQPQVLPLLHSSAYLSAVVFADTDGDGRDELYYGAQTTVAGEQRTLLDRYELGAGELTEWSGEPILAAASADGIWSLAAGDLNGDGFEDLVAGTGAGELWVYLADENGILRRDLSSDLPAARPSCVVRDLQVRRTSDATTEVFALFSGEAVSDPTTGSRVRGSGCEGGGRIAVWRVDAAPVAVSND